MVKEYIEYSAAALSARRGGVTLSADEYNGFSDIGLGGVLEVAENSETGLHLTGDADGKPFGYCAISPDDITRSTSASSECLKRRGDGGVVIVQNRAVECTEESDEQ